MNFLLLNNAVKSNQAAEFGQSWSGPPKVASGLCPHCPEYSRFMQWEAESALLGIETALPERPLWRFLSEALQVL